AAAGHPHRGGGHGDHQDIAGATSVDAVVDDLEDRAGARGEVRPEVARHFVAERIVDHDVIVYRLAATGLQQHLLQGLAGAHVDGDVLAGRVRPEVQAG